MKKIIVWLGRWVAGLLLIPVVTLIFMAIVNGTTWLIKKISPNISADNLDGISFLVGTFALLWTITAVIAVVHSGIED